MPSPSDTPNDPTNPRRSYRREVLVLLVFLILPAIGFFVLNTNRHGLAGVYLVGGTDYLHIVDTPTGAKIDHFRWGWMTGKPELRTFGGIRLEEESTHHGGPVVTRIHFKPSSTDQRNLDLIGIDQVDMGSEWYEYPLFYVKKFWPKPSGIVGAPIRNFLVRIDDPEILHYMTLAGKDPSLPNAGHGAAPTSATLARWLDPTPNSTQLVDIAQRMASRAPTDPYMHLILMDAHLRAAQPDEVRQLLAEWKPRFEQLKSSDAIPQTIAKWIKTKVDGLAAAQRGANALPTLHLLLARDSDHQSTFRNLIRMRDTEALTLPGGYLLPRDTVMNFLEAQTRAKLASVQSTFELVQGNPQRALDISLGAFRFGQLIQDHDNYLITQLIGIAVRTNALRSLEFLALNAPLSDEQCAQTIATLNRYRDKELLSTEANLTDGLPIHTTNYTEAATRNDVAYARFHITRGLFAARHALLSTGNLPRPGSTTTTLPMLPDGPGIDPFSPTSGPLRMIHNITSDTLVVYSVGPDQKDDGGAIEYDPTNGTISGGDITGQLPAAPRYPFPAGGIRADSTTTLLAMFPQGLPSDIFNRSTYAVSEALRAVETTGGLLVYSVGPDKEPEDYTHGNFVYYDPTNGTVSRGDLITTIAP